MVTRDRTRADEIQEISRELKKTLFVCEGGQTLASILSDT